MTLDVEARWMACMRRGDFDGAWRVNDELRQARVNDRGQRDWIWDGAPLDGKRVLVHCNHGLGDTIHFARYLPMLAGVASQVTVLAQRKLIPLLRGMPGSCRFAALDDGEDGVERDADVEIMELPYVFRSSLDSLPSSVPYLYVPPPTSATPETPATPAMPAKPAMSRPQRGPHNPMKVGLAWRAGDWNAKRSIPCALLLPLAAIPGLEIHILQRGVGLGERPESFGKLAAGNDLDGDAVADARLVSALDLVISVDSFPAHLAGALGRPTWTLLCSEPDWRWMQQRDDSPWYPTMRLLRQQRAGEWAPVVQRVAAMLREELASRVPRSRETRKFSPARALQNRSALQSDA